MSELMNGLQILGINLQLLAIILMLASILREVRK